MPNLAAWWQRQRTAYIPFLKKLQERKEEILPWAGGNSPNLWTNMQANQDLWHEARNIKGEIASIEKAARAYG